MCRGDDLTVTRDCAAAVVVDFVFWGVCRRTLISGRRVVRLRECKISVYDRNGGEWWRQPENSVLARQKLWSVASLSGGCGVLALSCGQRC